MNRRSSTLYLCFFISGASALIYEIVWQRSLTLVFGVTTFSIAAVVSAFLAGLAIGARAFGPKVDRSSNPLRLYAAIELTIAVAGLASGYVIAPLMYLYTQIHSAVDPGWLTSNLIRFALAFVAFGIPSILIGATAPIMARLLAERARSLPVGFGRFYAVNTIGSVTGAALAGFLLIRTIGVHNTLICAVLGNLVVATIAALAARGFSPASTEPPAYEWSPSPANTPHLRFALIVATAAGAIALAYEIAWMRLLAIFTFNSVYVFTIVITVFLTALALGAAISARLVQWNRSNRLRAITAVQIILALTVPIMLACISAANRFNITDPHLTSSHTFYFEYATAVSLIFIPAILIGMTLPLTVGIFSESIADAGRSIGRIYAWNAIGTIVGSATTGMLMIPLLGLRGTMLLLAAGNFLIAAIASLLDRNTPPAWRTATQIGAAAFVMLVAALPATTRFYRPGKSDNESIIYYAEGPSATVHVAEYNDSDQPYRSLYIDSKSVAGTYDEIVTDQKMLAHLPLLLHPDPQRALTVGFGTGGTSYSMLQHKIKVDCVEIEPRVPDAFECFKSQNKGIVGPNRDRLDFHLIYDDARSWLHVAPCKYDVIVTDVTSIQYRGNGNLYTTDYFRLMQSRLTPTGLGCAWVPITGVTEQQLKILIRSFQNVYAHTSVWYIINLPTDFVILVGSPDPLTIDLATIASRMNAPLVKLDLATIGMENPFKLAACLLLTDDDVRTYTDRGPLHTDDRPILDYLTHATAYKNTLTHNLTQLLEHRTNAVTCIASWPDTDSPEPSTDTWARWFEASNYLMQGHAALHTDPQKSLQLQRSAYQNASKLIPDDHLTNSLLTELEP